MQQSDREVLSAMSNELVLSAIPLFGTKLEHKVNLLFDIDEFLKRARRTRLTEETFSGIVKYFEGKNITVSAQDRKYRHIELTIEAIKLRMNAAQCRVFCERYPLVAFMGTS